MESDIEPRHIYYLLGFFSTLANLGMQFENQVESFMSLDFKNMVFNDHLSAADMTALISNLSSLLLPTEVETSLVELSGGIHVTGNKISQTLVGHSNELFVGVTNTKMAGYSNHTDMVAASFSFTQGEQSTNNSLEVTYEDDKEVKHITEKGTVLSKHLHYTGSELTIAATIAANDCNLSADDSLSVQANIQANKVVAEASHLNVAESTHIHADHLLFTAEKVEAHGNIEVAKTFDLVTENLDVNHAHIHSENNIHIEAKTGDLTGSQLETNTMMLDVGGVDPNKLINTIKNDRDNSVIVHQSLKVNTENNVTITNIRDDIDVDVSAPKITLDHPVKTSHDVRFDAINTTLNVNVNIEANNINLEAEKEDVLISKNIKASDSIVIKSKTDTDNTGKLEAGNNVLVVSESGDIHNQGKITAEQCTQIIAENGSVYNTCREWTVRGLYDAIKIWHPAEMNGDYLFVQAENVISNDASKMTAKHDVELLAREVQLQPRTHTYISYHTHSKTWCGQKNEKTEFSVQIAKPVIASNFGKILINTKDAIHSISATLVAKENVYLHSYSGKIILEGFIARGIRKIEVRENWFGLNSNKEERKYDLSYPTYILNDANVTIVADENDVNILNATINAKKLNVVGLHVTFTTPTLNDEYKRSSHGFNFEYPLLTTINRYTNGDFSTWLSPLSDGLKLFTDKKNGIALGLNVWKITVDSMNTFNRLLSPIANGNLISLLDDPLKVRIDYTETETQIHSQTPAPNIIHCQEFNCEAKEKVAFENGVPVIVDEDAHIKSKDFIQTGAETKFKIENQSKNVSFDITPHNVNVGLTMMDNETEATHFASQEFKVGGTLKVETINWQERNAHTVANSLEQNVENFSSISIPDHFETHAFSVQLSPTGISFSKNTEISDGSKSKSSIYSSTIPFNFNSTLDEAQKNISWLTQHPTKPVAALVEEIEFDDSQNHSFVSPTPEEKSSQHKPLPKSHEKQTKVENDINEGCNNDYDALCIPKNWMEQTTLAELNSSDQMVHALDCLNNKDGKTSLSCFKLFSEILTTFDESGAGKHINKLIVNALDVEHYCEIYNANIMEGKSHAEAIKEIGYEVSKDILETEGVASLLTHFGVKELIYPVFALQTALEIIAKNSDAVDGQIEIVRAQLPSRTSVTKFSFLAKATINHIHDELDQKSQFNASIKNLMN